MDEAIIEQFILINSEWHFPFYSITSLMDQVLEQIRFYQMNGSQVSVAHSCQHWLREQNPTTCWRIYPVGINSS